MILSNFHTHSNLVDGKNTLEEIVTKAIDLGFKTLGFSEHAYVSFDPDCCLSKEDTILYRDKVKELKEKYKDKIELLCGIEADFYSEDDFSAYDYVIGSVHYLKVKDEVYSVDITPEETMRCINNAFGGSFSDYAKYYFETVSKIYRKTGADIIGHFDLLTKFQNRGVAFDTSSKEYIYAWKSAMKELSENSVFEINTGAVFKGYRTSPYPSLEMLENLKSLGGKVIVSSDAHNVSQINFGFEEAKKAAISAGFMSAGFTAKNKNQYIQF